MIRPPPEPHRTATLVPATSLFRAHGCLGDIDHPAGVVQALGQNVAAVAVLLDHLRDAFLRAFECGYGRNLYGRERAIVVIAFDAGQSIDQLLVAHHETDSPTGHVVAFAHGEELDGDIARTLDLDRKSTRLNSSH